MSFNSKKFSAAILSRKGNRSYREIAQEADVAFTTLQRCVQENGMPDLQTFSAICVWLDATPNTFFDLSGKPSRSDWINTVNMYLHTAFDPEIARSIATIIIAIAKEKGTQNGYHNTKSIS